MEKVKADTIIAVFADHPAAETAVKKLTAAGFEMKNLSVVGKGYQSVSSVRDIKLTKRLSASTTWATESSFGASAAHSGVVSGAYSWAGCS